MPRFVVIGLFTLLAVGIIGGAVFLVTQRSGDEISDTTTTDGVGTESFGVLEPAGQGSPQQVVATDDDDNDGLSNADELLWGSDPANPDTDNDGYLDGEEIAAGHDPLKPAPDDKLTLADLGTQAPGEEEVSPLLSDQYLSANVSYAATNRNITADYENQYNADNRSAATMDEFAEAQTVEVMLPTPEDNEIPDLKENTPGMLSQYLNIADNRSAIANTSLYNQAQYDIKVNQNSETMLSLVLLVELYRKGLLDAPVPSDALSVHKLLLAYTTALIDTFGQIALYVNDPARSLVATKQLETIDRKYYPLIHDEFQRLSNSVGSGG